MGATVYYGDALLTLPLLADASVDAVVTDPPYALGFMGRAWDTHTPGGFQHWCELWAAECLRVLKPGGHLLAFGGTRTYHRLTAGIEDAGFEIRDSLHWLYGSGFPKSHDISKAIDKAAGDPLAFRRFARAYAEAVELSAFTHADIDRALGIKSSSCYWAREDHRGGMPPRHHWEQVRDLLGLSGELEGLYDAAEREVIGTRKQRANGADSGVPMNASIGDVEEITAPATDAAKQWQGWGTALKPAHEPIVLARKPLQGTVAANVLQHGTGALNVDGCRVAAQGRPLRESRSEASVSAFGDGLNGSRAVGTTDTGRWPANVLLDDDAAGLLDEQSGTLKSGAMGPLARSAESKPLFRVGQDLTYETKANEGGASRFFPVFRYQAKAGKKERPVVVIDGRKIAHPTVKPLALMRWLVDLVTPPGGLVLDPFAGTGTTLQAALDAGCTAIGIERSAPEPPNLHEGDYLWLIKKRLADYDLTFEGGRFATQAVEAAS